MRLLFLLLLFPLLASAQSFPKNENGNIEYTNVVSVDTTTAESLYSRAKIFLASAFSNSKNLIQSDDKENKVLVAEPLFQVTDKEKGNSLGTVKVKLIIQCRESRCKYTITDLYHQFTNPGGYNLSGGNLENEKPINPLSEEAFQKVKESASEKLNAFIKSLTAALSKSDNW
ncbi:MAG TPA: DUF4468 domain-containing protein [Chitinophagaceae bacterium]|nr:DUF4468 domain-containing protein [Chitinophagaceae bacterium]